MPSQAGVAARKCRASGLASPAVSVLQIPVQMSFDDLGTPLHEVTFVVVDLETTGGSPTTSGITEIGAVKVRGGDVLGQFQTLVYPGESIPAFIAALTGITNAMVARAPRIDVVLPTFLEFARGSVLVAHNAPFDLGFLKASCESLDISWPGFDTVDTVRLARRVLTRDEAPNCKLATLAQILHARVSPTHRALDDALATLDVLHALFERLGSLRVTTLEELSDFSEQGTAQALSQQPRATPPPSRQGSERRVAATSPRRRTGRGANAGVSATIGLWPLARHSIAAI